MTKYPLSGHTDSSMAGMCNRKGWVYDDGKGNWWCWCPIHGWYKQGDDKTIKQVIIR